MVSRLLSFLVIAGLLFGGCGEPTVSNAKEEGKVATESKPEEEGWTIEYEWHASDGRVHEQQRKDSPYQFKDGGIPELLFYVKYKSGGDYYREMGKLLFEKIKSGELPVYGVGPDYKPDNSAPLTEPQLEALFDTTSLQGEKNWDEIRRVNGARHLANLGAVHLEFTQDWIWNDETQELSIRNISIALIPPMFPDASNPGIVKPMCFILPQKDRSLPIYDKKVPWLSRKTFSVVPDDEGNPIIDGYISAFNPRRAEPSTLAFWLFKSAGRGKLDVFHEGEELENTVFFDVSNERSFTMERIDNLSALKVRQSFQFDPETLTFSSKICDVGLLEPVPMLDQVDEAAVLAFPDSVRQHVKEDLGKQYRGQYKLLGWASVCKKEQ